MKLRIGRRLTVEVQDFAEASAVYCKARKESGEGGSTFPVGSLPGHYVSYNGKVWAGTPKDWQSGMTPVFNPY
jgi:hypothetical protein